MPNLRNTDLVKAAEAIARVAHSGQTRRDGVTPYIVHPEAVVSRLLNYPKLPRTVTAETIAVAWLHDVLEDTSTTAQALLDAGMPQSVVDAVVLLTKVEGVSYEEYINRLSSSQVARTVKIADMKHNLSCSPTPRKAELYRSTLEFLRHKELSK